MSATLAATPAAQSSVVFHRSFQRPTGLTNQSIIALEVTLFEPLTIDVELNGNTCSLERRSDTVFEVALGADQLEPVNELQLTVHLPASANAIDHPKLGQDYISRVDLVLS